MDGRLRAVEVTQATQTAELEATKEIAHANASAIGEYRRAHDDDARERKRESRRFMTGVLMLVITALVGAYFIK